MSIKELNSIDGMGVSENRKELALLISDHLDWENEYDHLMLLQKKINAYISFIETKQYKSIYPQYEFERFVIDIRFKYDIIDNCYRFIETASKQIKPLNIIISTMVLE